MQDSEKIKVTAFPHDNVCLLYTLPRTLRDSTGYLYEIALDPSACLSSHTATGQCLCMEEREVTNFYNISCEPGTALHPADPDPENFISHFITGFPRLGQYLILTRQQ